MFVFQKVEQEMQKSVLIIMRETLKNVFRNRGLNCLVSQRNTPGALSYSFVNQVALQYFLFFVNDVM